MSLNRNSQEKNSSRFWKISKICSGYRITDNSICQFNFFFQQWRASALLLFRNRKKSRHFKPRGSIMLSIKSSSKRTRSDWISYVEDSYVLRNKNYYVTMCCLQQNVHFSHKKSRFLYFCFLRQHQHKSVEQFNEWSRFGLCSYKTQFIHGINSWLMFEIQLHLRREPRRIVKVSIPAWFKTFNDEEISSDSSSNNFCSTKIWVLEANHSSSSIFRSSNLFWSRAGADCTKLQQQQHNS